MKLLVLAIAGKGGGERKRREKKVEMYNFDSSSVPLETGQGEGLEPKYDIGLGACQRFSRR